MASLTVYELSSAGLAENHVSADPAGDYVQNNDGRVYLDLSNHTGQDIGVIVHFNSNASIDGVQATNRTITVPDGVSYWAGPYPPHYFNDSNNRLQITYSDPAHLTGFSTLPFHLGTFPQHYKVG